MHEGHVHIKDSRYRETRNVTIVGAIVDLLLGIGKIITGVLSGSSALIADGIHSLSDLGTDIVVLIAAKHASREADEEHPYGHGRIETVGTVVLGVALIIVAVGICYEAGVRLFTKEYLTPGYAALIVAIISIIAKEAIYHYTMHYAKKLRSKMLEANAWHSRSDSISSVIVVVGIIGTMQGLEYLDAIAAILVGFIIIRIGWQLSLSSLRELVDTGLDQDTVEKIRSLILSVDGVKDLHYLRTRTMGSEALVDVHIQVNEDVSVSEGHFISETVRLTLVKDMEEIGDVMVHIDPEDDQEMTVNNLDLPLRHKLLEELEHQWQTMPVAKQVKKVTLHYLDGTIRLEIVLPMSCCQDLEQADRISSELKKLSLEHPDVGDVQVYFSF